MRPAPGNMAFLELFRGAGGLSRRVQARAGDRCEVLSRAKGPYEVINVGCDEDFTKILDAEALWVHGAPPCRTFSRARRSDQFARVKRLRTEERPKGFGCPETAVANKLALRMQEIALNRGDKEGD